MTARQNSRYPYHLAKLVAERLSTDNDHAPSDKLLLRLFETLYFASLKTDESRPCRCTINYIDPSNASEHSATEDHASGWTVVAFDRPLVLDVRSLLKLAEAADPTVSSLAVFSDEGGELYIWGMVDQELRYGHYVSLDATEDPKRPGLFQAAITGVGAISVYKNFKLVGSLEQHNLVTEYHDVLWEGPIHRRLKGNLEATLQGEQVTVAGDSLGSKHLLREAPLSQFGTRHRAMLRYCDENEEALGFVISQDGDIRATMKHRGRVVLWENINVQLAYRSENRGTAIPNFSPATISGIFQYWMHSVASARTA